jgi:hypothetical protein
MTTSANEGPDRQLWAVELLVERPTGGVAWRHRWQGYAATSTAATALAVADLFGEETATATDLRPRVISCAQVRV